MSDDNLRERLQQYPQVGEARADEIIALVREHSDAADADALRADLDAALDHAEHPGYAFKFVRRARERL